MKHGAIEGTPCAFTVVNPPVITLMRKVTPPFKFVVTGSNLQNGIRVFFNGVE